MANSSLRVLALVTDAFGGHGGIAVVTTFCKARYQSQILAFDIAIVSQLARKPLDGRQRLRRKDPDGPHPLALLPARRERPKQRRRRGAAEKRDEFAAPYPAHSRASGNPDATVRGSGSPLSRGRTEFGGRPPHSITSSARSKKESGIVNPIALAALRFIANSNFVGCSTGRAAGLVPCKILFTYAAARRNKSGWLAP